MEPHVFLALYGLNGHSPDDLSNDERRYYGFPPLSEEKQRTRDRMLSSSYSDFVDPNKTNNNEQKTQSDKEKGELKELLLKENIELRVAETDKSKKTDGYDEGRLRKMIELLDKLEAKYK